MMIVTLIDIFINTYKQLLKTAGPFQGHLFSIGSKFWNWSPPSFFTDSSYLYAL
jgi:hypothetical protein